MNDAHDETKQAHDETKRFLAQKEKALAETKQAHDESKRFLAQTIARNKEALAEKDKALIEAKKQKTATGAAIPVERTVINNVDNFLLNPLAHNRLVHSDKNPDIVLGEWQVSA